MELRDIIHLIVGGDSDFIVVRDSDRETIFDDRKVDTEQFMRFLESKGNLKSYAIEARGNVIVIYI